MIDFHCHIDLYKNPQAVVRKANDLGMYVLAVTTTPKAWKGSVALVGESPKIRLGLGLHPELVMERHNELDLFCKFLPQAQYVGEIGIDGSKPHRNSLELQCRVFEKILAACSGNGGRIMSIHSRMAVPKVIERIKDCPTSGVPVFHWFSGTIKQAEAIIDLGGFFSVGPKMCRSKKGSALLTAIPKDRIITETDGPLTLNGDAPFYPWDVRLAIEGLASIWKEDEASADSQITSNFSHLIRSYHSMIRISA